ncbi:MAG: YybS family protein [Synergistaceae bacterium]|nr:YybS family protein [Synergistaceae bacterium]
MKGKVIFEWFFWILLSVLMFMAGIEIAFLLPLIILAAPVPLMILVCRHGVREGTLGAVFGTLFVYVIMGPVSAFLYTCEFALLGLLMGILMIKVRSGADYVIFALLASLAVKMLMMGGFHYAAGVNPFMMTPEAAQGLAASVSAALSQGGVPVSPESVNEYVETMAQTVSLMMPAMLILFAAADTMTGYVLTRLYFKRAGGVKLPALPPFVHWRFPKNIFWALLAALILDMASKAFPDDGLYRMLSLNLMEVLRGIFLVEGLSLLWYFMSAYKVNKAIRVILTLFCAFFATVSYVLSMIGIFDIWYDLRRRIKLRRK